MAKLTVYYNENDAQKAAWLRELVRAGVVADGEVDDRSIKEVAAEDVRGFAQCHFFAGIGAWSYSLRLAGWPDDRPVWTGSCPCPSFSAAGKGGGFNDPRHLWPDWYRLIRKCQPATIFGEQADDAIGYGWLDLVQTDLEREAYAVGKAVLGACSVGAPHIRQRLYFVADASESRFGGDSDRGAVCRRKEARARAGEPERLCKDGGLADSDSERRREARDSGRAVPAGKRDAFELGNSGTARLQKRERDGRVQQFALVTSEREAAECRGFVNGFWRDADWVLRKKWNSDDSEWCPTEPGTFPLAHGVAGRVLKLRGYGDCIVPQVAAAFIEAAVAPVTGTGRAR